MTVKELHTNAPCHALKTHLSSFYDIFYRGKKVMVFLGKKAKRDS